MWILIYIIIFILSSHLIHMVAVDQQSVYNPYPFGTTFFCIIQHPLLLIMSIYYLGWLWGIVLFLCHIFGIIHATVSWVLSIPRLITNDHNKLLRIMKRNIAMLIPMFIIVLVFTIVSFFVADYECLLTYLYNHTSVLICTIVIIVVLSITRIILAKKASNY